MSHRGYHPPEPESDSDVDSAVDQKRDDIARMLSSLGRRHEAGDDSELLVWVIPDKLACVHRPLRHHPLYGGSGRNLACDARDLVFDWAERIKTLEVKGIICLMHDRDIGYYSAIDLGASNLVEFYKSKAFDVIHLPWEDPHHSRTDRAERKRKFLEIRPRALAAYDDLPKPVVLQCSAGIDRSSPIAAYVWYERGR